MEDFERNKLREQLVAEMNFPGGLDCSRPFIVVSEDAIRAGKTTYPPPVPLEMMEAAGWPFQRTQKFKVKSLDDPLRIQVTPEERERFNRGEPLLIRGNVFGIRSTQSGGGQRMDDIEGQINDAFAVTVFVIFERLQYLVPLRDGKNVRNWADQEAAQDFIFDKELLSLPWPESDFRKTRKRRRGLLDTSWRNGQRSEVLPCLYPSSRLREEIAAWAESFRGRCKDVIEQEIRFQKTQFVALNMCRERAREFRRIENEISKSIRRKPDDESFDPTQVEVALGFNHSIDGGAVFPAAYAGDFDPRLMFYRLASVKSFGFIRQLGRIARGQSATLPFAQLADDIEASRRHLEAQPELFSERQHPALMSGREFLLYAYAAYEGQRAVATGKPDAVKVAG